MSRTMRMEGGKRKQTPVPKNQEPKAQAKPRGRPKKTEGYKITLNELGEMIDPLTGEAINKIKSVGATEMGEQQPSSSQAQSETFYSTSESQPANENKTVTPGTQTEDYTEDEDEEQSVLDQNVFEESEDEDPKTVTPMKTSDTRPRIVMTLKRNLETSVNKTLCKFQKQSNSVSRAKTALDTLTRISNNSLISNQSFQEEMTRETEPQHVNKQLTITQQEINKEALQTPVTERQSKATMQTAGTAHCLSREDMRVATADRRNLIEEITRLNGKISELCEELDHKNNMIRTMQLEAERNYRRTEEAEDRLINEVSCTRKLNWQNQQLLKERETKSVSAFRY